MATIPPPELAYQEAHIHENNGPAAIAVIAVFGFLALVSLVVRLVHRIKVAEGLGLDDYLMVGSALFTLAATVSAFEAIRWGIGRHVIAIPPENFAWLGKWAAVGYLAYPLSISLAKWSILALIARVFRLDDKRYKYAIWFVAVYTFLWTLGSYLGVGLACQPFDSLWSVSAPCEIPDSLTKYTTIFDIIGDFMVILVPQGLIWSLHMTTRHKIAVSLLMSLGVFCSITGIVRIVVTDEKDPYDPTYSATLPLIFVELEILVAIICGCLPTMTQTVYATYMAARGFARSTISLLSSRSRSSSHTVDEKGGRGGHSSDGKTDGTASDQERDASDVESQRDRSQQDAYQDSSTITKTTEIEIAKRAREDELPRSVTGLDPRV